MNENINLCEILKDCPKGTKLYSPILGEVEFQEIDEKDYRIIVLAYFFDVNYPTNGFYTKKYFTSDGKYLVYYKDTECLLFPSKDQRDWSKFTAPWYKKEKFDPKTLKAFDRVLVRDEKYVAWRCGFFSHKSCDNTSFPYLTVGQSYRYCIPYNDDTKHLVGTTDEAPEYYRYWEE